MKPGRIALAVAAVGLTASAFAADIRSGLQIGEKCGAFQVVDANGTKVGKQHCWV